MKRYRLHWWNFDTRANILNINILDEREDIVKESWLNNQRDIILWLKLQYWEINFEQKLNNFKDFWGMPLSVIYFHNSFFLQIRESFIIWWYYPSLTWVCSLWERILNHLVNWLKNDFRSDTDLKYYKDVYSKLEFKSDNWEKMIEILDYWEIFDDWVSEIFLKLKDIRNKKAIHFNVEIENNQKLREITLEAIKYIYGIIDLQFWWIWKNKKWLIEWTKWAFFIKKEYENNPFVKNIIIPSCILVWNKHRVEYINWKLVIIDNNEYENIEITDEEFAKFYS